MISLLFGIVQGKIKLELFSLFSSFLFKRFKGLCFILLLLIWLSKLNLFERTEIIKVAIDNYSQYKNYYEYTDDDTIDKIYNLFKYLETNVESKNSEPENPEELYKVVFFNNEFMLVESDNDIFKAIVYVYKKDNRYYVEEQKNGIYEITEEEFNMIKSYAK